MRRFVVLHPLAAVDAAVLTASGLCFLGSQAVSRGLLWIADWLDARLAAATDLGGENE